MAENAPVHTTTRAEVWDRTCAEFDSMGLTMPDAVRLLLSPTAKEGVPPWFAMMLAQHLRAKKNL
jgi:DNA-damage-inducible protein J